MRGWGRAKGRTETCAFSVSQRPTTLAKHHKHIPSPGKVMVLQSLLLDGLLRNDCGVSGALFTPAKTHRHRWRRGPTTVSGGELVQPGQWTHSRGGNVAEHGTTAQEGGVGVEEAGHFALWSWGAGKGKGKGEMG